MQKHLHIISLYIPYPVQFGAMHDLFYKLPALQQLGVKIHLHCFHSGSPPQPELNKYCESVHYYRRKTGFRGLSRRLPYIVSSRNSEELTNNLLRQDYPIIMEGVHCTWLTNDVRFDNRKKFVRLYNVETLYYRHLFTHSNDLLKKAYYWYESRLLRKYEASLVTRAAALWAVSHKDAEYYRNRLHAANVHYMSMFLPPWQIKPIEGMGVYCLYHGNLSVAENERAAVWLMQNVFNTITIPLVIAGKNPPAGLLHTALKYKNVSLIANPGEDAMQEMIAKAHINVLPSFNSTGVKLKLLNALFNGRHCVVNADMTEGTGLETLCHVVNTASAFREVIEQLYHQFFTNEETEFRKYILSREFDNDANAKKIINWVWGEQPLP